MKVSFIERGFILLKLNQVLKRRATFYKYLASYIVAFSLPVLFLLIYFYPQSSKIIEQNAIGNANAILTQTINNINLQLKGIRNYPDAIQKNKNLNSNMFADESRFNAYLIMQEMKKLF